MPNARTNAAIARPPLRPRLAPATTTRTPTRWLGIRKPWNSPWKISHSLTNPFSGGSAAIPNVPMNVIAADARKAMDEPAEPVHVPRAGGVLDHAGLQEQQRLVRAVVRHVVQGGEQQERGQRPLL